MICPLHPSLGEQGECEACINDFPPDLGVAVNDAAQTTDRFG